MTREWYRAHFRDSTNGDFIVVCRGFSGTNEPDCVYPTVEQAIQEYSCCCVFIGLCENRG